MTKKIITSHVCPPIPWRDFDWCAYFDGEEELAYCGYGRTAQDAIDDLLTTYGNCPIRAFLGLNQNETK